MNPLRGDDPQLNSVVEAIHAAIPASLAELARRASPEALAGYALCTDNDERTLYATAYRMADLDSFRWRTFRYLPAEWPLEDFSEPIAAASRALERWADHHYSIEPDSVNPSDDHLRPWKAVTFNEIVAVLTNHRAAGTFRGIDFVMLTSHDPNDWMANLIINGTRQLNPPGIYDEWRVVWKECYGG